GLGGAVTAPALRAVRAPGGSALPAGRLVRSWTIHYRAHDGLVRRAYVVLPQWYGPRDNPPLPLIISPHGRGVPAIDNVRIWGELPGRGGFALIDPPGQGPRAAPYSLGDPAGIAPPPP